MPGIYNGLLYNNDVDMSLETNDTEAGSLFTPIENDSSYEPPVPPTPTLPEVIDLDPSNTIARVIDGWQRDMSANGGTAGTVYTDTAPTEKPENPAQRTKTIYTQTQTIISNYDSAYLQSLDDAGADFYVVYTDGTRDSVTLSEIVDPHPRIEQNMAGEAEEIARAINQNFWNDTNGVHVTDTPQDDWFTALANQWPGWPDTTPYYNILMNSLGILLRTQLINLSSWSRSGIAFYNGEGNTANDIVASFGKSGSLLRANGRDVMRVTPNGVVFVPLEGNEVSVTMITDDISNLQNVVADNQSDMEQALANLQAQIDGVVDTYYEEVDPEYEGELTDSSNANVIDSNSANIETLSKTPWMYDWTTDDIKALHEGDLYYNITTGHAWRWLKVDNVWQWYRIADSDVAEALQIARNANTLAGTKKRVFTATPTVPYDVGDMWVSGSNIKYATVAKATGQSYSESDWTLTATDDTLATTALNKANTNEQTIGGLNGEVTLIKSSYVTNATFTQNNTTWAANLITLETNLKSYSDNGVSTAMSQEVINRNAAITAKANEITSSVSATYQVKGDYATATQLNNEVTARNTAIQQSAGNILSTVAETYATQEELGTYVNQTSDSVTTIIGDLSSIQSIVYYQQEVIDKNTNDLSDKNNAYYFDIDPVYEDTLTDSSNRNISDSSSHDVSTYSFSSLNPAYKWNSTEERDEHVGDQYFNIINGRMWRYTSDYIWSYVQNKEAHDAYELADEMSRTLPAEIDAATTAARNASQSASSAASIANSKSRVFTTTPAPPYSVGDLWRDGHDVKCCIIARASGSYNAADWAIAATDNYALTQYQDTVATIIRETTAGVVVAKAGASLGTLQGSSNFKVVGINAWNGSTPTIGSTYALFGANGLSVYDNTGSYVLSFFGVENNLPLARIGRQTKGNVEVGVNSSGNGYIDFYNGSTLLGHIGYDSGTNSTGGTSKAPYQSFGVRYPDSTIGNYSFVEGYNNTASGYAAHAEGSYTKATGICAHAEGYRSEATANYAHAEGNYTKARANYAHAEGNNARAEGYGSHAEGYLTAALGDYSHAEGGTTTASGDYSHASGYYTTAAYSYQTAIGKYNSNLSSDLFEIGNGNSSTNSNAFRVTTSNTAYVGSTQVTSDMRIKTDLGILDINEAVEFIKSLTPHAYEKFGKKELGFFAQDVEKDIHYGSILVEQYEDHGYKDFRSLSYNGLIAPMVAALQSCLQEIDILKKKLKERE